MTNVDTNQPLHAHMNGYEKAFVDGESDRELNEEDKRIIIDDWVHARKDLQLVGTKLFVLFFAQNPSYVKKFSWADDLDGTTIADIPLDQLPKRLHSHGLNVTRQVTFIVDNLDNPEELTRAFKIMGNQHARRGITQKHFENLAVSILALLRQLLTPLGYNDRHDVAWSKALTVITMASLKTTDEAEKAMLADESTVSKDY